MTDLGKQVLEVLASNPMKFFKHEEISDALGLNYNYDWEKLGAELGHGGNINVQFYKTKFGIPDSYKITKAGLEFLRNPPVYLTLEHIAEVSHARYLIWHKGEQPWTPERFITAIVGELGEMANITKKLFRAADGSVGILNGATTEELENNERKEWADTMLYLILFAATKGWNQTVTLREVFNAKSEQLGFEERL